MAINDTKENPIEVDIPSGTFGLFLDSLYTSNRYQHDLNDLTFVVWLDLLVLSEEWQDPVMESLLLELASSVASESPWKMFMLGADRGNVAVCRAALRCMLHEKDETVKVWSEMRLANMTVHPADER